ncbi:MAG: HIT family protein [Planctomycetia bacterium]|jgi:histidine triad (HIT) family protein
MHGSHPTFAELVAGRVDAEIVAEDEGHVAFLSPTPFRPGHVVVATRRVVPYLYDLPEDEHARLWSFVRRVALVQKERLGCERVCTSVVGWVVRHAHVHLVPTDAEGQHPGLPGAPADRDELRRLGRVLRGESVQQI